VSPKLSNQLKVLENTIEPDEFKEINYGCIETYVLWNLSKEKSFQTDITCACCTGFYDIYEVNFNLFSRFYYFF
jgi:glycerol kinase